MKQRWILVVFILLLFSVCIAGCAAGGSNRKTAGQPELEGRIEALKKEVASLEAQIRSQRQQFSSLQEELGRVGKEKQELEFELAKRRIIGQAEEWPNDIEQVKVALINAGYHPGPINMTMTPQTQEAIKAFQKDNNLSADGIIGKKTWKLLRKHLYERKD